MFNFGILINDFYTIFNKKQTIFEIILNLSFILILFAVAFIFYWDSINRNVINTSRCKAIIKNDDATYTAYFYSDKQAKEKKVFSISYDNTRNHNVKISCEGVCAKPQGAGTTERQFKIPYFNYKEQVIDDSYIKRCYCDNNSIQGIPEFHNYGINGDEFLADYYTGFYGNGGTRAYNSKLFFPQ